MSHTPVAGDLERTAERCQVTGTRSAKPSSDMGSRRDCASLQAWQDFLCVPMPGHFTYREVQRFPFIFPPLVMCLLRPEMYHGSLRTLGQGQGWRVEKQPIAGGRGTLHWNGGT